MKTFRSFQNSTGSIAAVWLIVPTVIIGCSTPRIVRFDDALDIVPSRQFHYETAPCICDETNSNRRDGRTLRGTVLEMLVKHRRDTAGTPRQDTFFLFISRCASEQRNCLELIPISDVILPTRQQGMERNTYGNVNRVRLYNTVTGIPAVRDVPVRMVGCDCEPLELGSLRLPSWSIRCPERQCQWYFLELRAIPGAFAYSDWQDRNTEVQRNPFSAEIAAGFRIGRTASMKRREGLNPSNEEPTIYEETSYALQTDYCYRWALGLALTTGNRAFNMFSASPPEDYNRPTLTFHVRYNFDRNFACMRPFIYGQLGTAIDRLTMQLWRLSLRIDRQKDEKIDEIDSLLRVCGINIPGLNFVLPSYSLRMNASAPPLTFGFGAGVEFPITSFFDLGVDIGYRSLGIGDELLYNGTRIPQGRRIGLWRLRVGLTF